MSKESKAAGGIKGFLQKTGKAGLWAFETGNSLAQWTYRYGGKAAFVLATTSMVVLMPLLFEITREGQVGGWRSLQLNQEGGIVVCTSHFCFHCLTDFGNGTHGSKRSSKERIRRSTTHGIRIYRTGVAFACRFDHDICQISIANNNYEMNIS